jgi:hypothetical protein
MLSFRLGFQTNGSDRTSRQGSSCLVHFLGRLRLLVDDVSVITVGTDKTLGSKVAAGGTVDALRISFIA